MDILTERLRIRDLQESDAEALHRLRTDPLVYRFNHFGPETLAETRNWIVRTTFYNQRLKRDSHNCTILLRTTGESIGWIGFGFSHPQALPFGDVGIGYAILPEAWNQGYTTEALRATLDYIFSNTAAENANAHCNVGNPASARVMEKAGMIFSAQRPNPEETMPEKAESFHYQLSRANWQHTARDA